MRIAVAGLGVAGHTLHLPALASLPNVEVVGGCDLDPAMRDRAAETWNLEVYGDYQRMLDRVRPDVVIVGTPPSTHAQYTIDALAVGAHVICEKPFTASIAEADAVIAAAAAANRSVALNHEFPEMPIFKSLREALQRSDVGKVRCAQVWQLMDLAPGSEAGWRGGMKQRTLYEAGVHLIDYLLRLFEERPASVTCSTSSATGDRDGDAVVMMTLEFSGGRLAQVTQNRVCKGPTQYFDVRVDAAKASLRASFGGRARVWAGLHRSTKPRVRLELGVSGMAWIERGAEREVIARNGREPEMHATRCVIRSSIEAFQNGAAPPTTAEDGRAVLQVIAAGYRSASEGRRISMTEEELTKLSQIRFCEP